MEAIIKEDLEFIISAKIPWHKLEGKNILISGANGFLPSYMVKTILFLNDYLFKKKLKFLL
jgi:UDP-glucuronate decarboxylase